MPTTDEEVWRYSRIDELDLDQFTPAEPPGRAASQSATVAAGEWEREAGGVAATVVVVDGAVLAIDVAAGWAAKGLEVVPLAELDDGQALLGEPEPAVDLFGDLNEAFACAPLVVRVPAGMQVDAPLYVHFASTNRIDGQATFPRLVVDVGEGASLALIEHHESGEGKALAVPVTQLRIGPAARLGHLTVQELGPATWQFAHQVAEVGQEATFTSAVAALGGDYARLRTDCRLVGRGATGTLLAAYFGEGAQMLDFRTFQQHEAPDTTSNLLYKGAVADESRSVYTGLIKVHPEARGTNAFQTNRNVKLSQRAWAESVPNLEIENNDVRCSHASAVGPIDEDQLFYLESRGVPPKVAERLIVAGFFDEVLQQLPVRGTAAPLRRRIGERLDRREEST